ncbi:MAG: GyrI-like domain-containing protein [Taibaiella sp.]|jgi:hypothetical protein
MLKTDFTKKYKAYYSAKTEPELIQLDPVVYLSVTGKGDPSDKKYADKIQLLYTIAYSIKFSFKAREEDFVVPKLEALWWFDEEQYKNIPMNEAPTRIPRSEWYYRLLIRMPENINDTDVAQAISSAADKQSTTTFEQVELFKLTEGKCVQMLHIGPFDREPESLEKILAFSIDHNLKRNGLHHEIYLSDFRKTSPEKLRTILREPVR